MADKNAKRQRRIAENAARQYELDRLNQAEHKAQRRLAKVQARQEKIIDREPALPPPVSGDVDVACLIHGTTYSWDYVERLHSMVTRNLSHNVRFHVYTEESRTVPDSMIKHSLVDWPNIFGPRKGWWYKMQIFNPAHHAGPLLYFDLDTVIVKNIDWIPAQSTRYFWAPKDFRQLWRASHSGINSSVMWWDTDRYTWIWEEFQKRDIHHLARIHHGDQDYISSLLTERDLRYFPPLTAASWRWQCFDGGMDFRNRKHLSPNSGTSIDHRTSIMIFHGSPKPHELTADPTVSNFWL
jgi:hypothetical protein